MINKRFLAAGFTAVLTIANVAYAHHTLKHSGFYVGAGAGIEQDMIDYGPLSGAASESIRITLTNHLDEYKNHLNAAVFAGYRAQFAHFFFDSELSGQFANHEVGTYLSSSLSSTEYTNITATATLSSITPAVDFHLGKRFCKNTAVFVSVGAALGRKHLSSVVVAEDTFGPDTTSGTVPASAGANSLGVRFGLGLEEAVSRSASLRLSYVYSIYNSLSVSGSGTFGDGATLLDVTNSATAKFDTQAVMLSAVFRFA